MAIPSSHLSGVPPKTSIALHLLVVNLVKCFSENATGTTPKISTSDEPKEVMSFRIQIGYKAPEHSVPITAINVYFTNIFTNLDEPPGVRPKKNSLEVWGDSNVNFSAMIPQKFFPVAQKVFRFCIFFMFILKFWLIFGVLDCHCFIPLDPSGCGTKEVWFLHVTNQGILSAPSLSLYSFFIMIRNRY